MDFANDSVEDATPLYQPNDFIALRLGQLAASRVTEATLRRFRDDLHRFRRPDRRYIQLWDATIEAGTDAVRRLLTEPSERGQVMRSLISFRAFVSKAERDAIFHESARAVIAGWRESR